MKWIVDRIEGDFAVVEYAENKTYNIPTALLPKDTAEGDVLEISINADESANRKRDINKLMNSLFED